mmetsp:Transcript_7785/g.19758  ORF Transcript_7785/g.19758 Transcript_7785/m.19758 type:complete len:234 (+) Transcript_7785:258-959(+)
MSSSLSLRAAPSSSSARLRAFASNPLSYKDSCRPGLLGTGRAASDSFVWGWNVHSRISSWSCLADNSVRHCSNCSRRFWDCSCILEPTSSKPTALLAIWAPTFAATFGEDCEGGLSTLRLAIFGLLKGRRGFCACAKSLSDCAIGFGACGPTVFGGGADRSRSFRVPLSYKYSQVALGGRPSRRRPGMPGAGDRASTSARDGDMLLLIWPSYMQELARGSSSANTDEGDLLPC